MLKSLIPFIGLALWKSNPIWTVFLWFDGIIYSLVSYSYKIFMIMTQINYNVIYNMMEPLVDRVKALIMVFIMFKIGCALLQYLVDPDKMNESKVGGKALVTNILITAGILGIYNFVFALSNDLSMLMVGSFDGSAFQVLDPPGAGDEGGLIGRFVFGANGSIKNIENFGKYLSTSTLSIFLHSAPDSKTNEAESIYAEILAAETEDDKDDFDMMRIVELDDDIGRTVQYRYPVLSGLVGLFLIYSIIKIAIEVGVRMFKLIVLQIIAPIPICAIVSDGVSGGMFKKYTDLFLSTFAEVFVRIASMYLMTGFIGEFYAQVMGSSSNGKLFTGGTTELSVITKGILLVIVVVAGYRFVNILPDFLGKVFSGLGGDKEKNGFGKFMGGLAGGVAGLGTGLMAGITSGAGLTGTIGSGLAGAFGGAQSGAKGKDIAESFKNITENNTKNRERAQKIARQGGGGFAGGLKYAGGQIEQGLGFSRRKEERAAKSSDAATALSNYSNARSEALKGAAKQKNTNGAKWGANKSEYRANAAEVDSRMQNLLRERQMSMNGVAGTRSLDDINKDIRDRNKVFDDEFDIHASGVYSSDSGVKNAKKEAEIALSRAGHANRPIDSDKQIEDASGDVQARASQLMGRGSVRRAHRADSLGGKK